MEKTVLFDEWHLAVRVPAGLAERQARPIRRVLAARQLRSAILRAVRAVARQHPALATVRFRFTR